MTRSERRRCSATCSAAMPVPRHAHLWLRTGSRCSTMAWSASPSSAHSTTAPSLSIWIRSPCSAAAMPPRHASPRRCPPQGSLRLQAPPRLTRVVVPPGLHPLRGFCPLGRNTVRYGGVLAPAARWRPLVIPPVPADANADDSADVTEERKHATRRSGWRPWAELLKRSFDIDLRCSRCGGPMKLKSFLTSPKSLRRLLTRLGEPTEVQGKAPARAPPYFVSKVARRHLAQHSSQLDYGVACQSRQIGSQPRPACPRLRPCERDGGGSRRVSTCRVSARRRGPILPPESPPRAMGSSAAGPGRSVRGRLKLLTRAVDARHGLEHGRGFRAVARWRSAGRERQDSAEQVRSNSHRVNVNATCSRRAATRS